MRKIFQFIFIALSLQSVKAQTARQLENLKAFSKTYGYIRYYHPSDEGSSIDWDKFAVYGVSRVLNCQDDEALKDSLIMLFSPIVPEIQFSQKSKKLKIPLRRILPKDTTGLKPIFWQHNSIGFGKEHLLGEYASLRANRPAIVIPPIKSITGRHSYTIDVSEYQGLPLKISAKVKKQSGAGFALIRYLNPENDGLINDEYFSPSNWKEVMIEDRIESDAKKMQLTIGLQGAGEVFFDDLTFQVFKNQTWITLLSRNFENEKIDSKQNDEYLLKTLNKENNTFLSIKSLPKPAPFAINKGNLIPADFPKIGDFYRSQINQKLFVVFPLVLMGSENQTFPATNQNKLENVQGHLKSMPTAFELDIQDLPVRLANICMLWNVVQHFYPYMENIEVEWDNELTKGFINAFDNKSHQDFVLTIRKMLSPLRDAHTAVYNMYLPEYYLPVQFYTAESKLYISKVWKDAPSNLKVGDVVSAINGMSTEEYIAKNRPYILYGSPSNFAIKLGNFLSIGERNTKIELVLNQGETDEKEVVLSHTRRWFNEQDNTEIIHEIEKGIYLIDCSMLDLNTFNANLDTFKYAKGLIFDVRNYPATVLFLNHFLKQPNDVTSNQYTKISMKPDQNDLEYSKFGWSFLDPSPVQINAKAVFLGNGVSISRAETLLSIVKHFKLGTIVGEPTGGTNGGAIDFSLAGGYTVYITASSFHNPDGSLHHTIGVLPDIEVNPSIKAIREGRDEILEKALEVFLKEFVD